MVRKNALINGDFQIWQRGVRIQNPNHLQHTVDRWNVDWRPAPSNGAFQIVRMEFPLGQTDVPGEPRYFARWEQLTETSGNNFRDFSQQIESVRTLAGQTVTISCYLRTSNQETVYLVTEQFFGGGGGSDPLFRTSDPIPVTSQWQKSVFTTTLHSIVGKKLGSVGDDCLNVIISMRGDSANHKSLLDIADVQIELAAIATPFERLSAGQQLSDCERYFQKSYDFDIAPGTPSFSGTENCRQDTQNNVLGVRYRKALRRPPTITLYNPRTGAIGTWHSHPSQAVAVSAGDVGTNGFHVDVVAGAGIPGAPLAGHWTANAEF